MWLDQKYIGLLSGRLDRFKRINAKTYNFRCPICGDSRTNKFKARGFLFEKDQGGFLYHCHNCSITLGLDKLMEQIDNTLYREYVLEKMSLSGERKKTPVEQFADKMKAPKFISSTPLKNIKKISQLKWDHPAKQYVSKRQIPTAAHSRLFYAPKFKHWVNTVVPNKFENLDHDEPRLVIPFLDADKNLIGFQGRSFNPRAALRYITIMVQEGQPKIFGLDNCDRNKLHYIVEGPIDCLFLSNAIAMAGGSIDWSYVNENSVFVYDNEPRSKETIDKIHKVYEKNHKVCIWPEFIKEKDINDMILSQKIPNLEEILEANISEGLEAKLILTAWRKI